MVNRAQMLLALCLGLGSLSMAWQQSAEEQLLLDEIHLEIAGGNYRRAQRMIEDFMPEQGIDSSLSLALAKIQFLTGEYELAQENLSKLLQQDATQLQAHYDLAEVLRARGNYLQALQHYTKAAQGNWELRALNGQAMAQRALGARDEAKTLWQQMAKIAAQRVIEDADELYALGQAYEQLDRPEWASQVYLEAAEKNPSHAKAWLALGDLYSKVYGDTSGVGPSPRSAYNECLKINKEDVGCNLSLFILYRNNFARDQALTQGFLQTALKVNPNSVRALQLQTDILLEDRRFADALNSIKKALQVNPHDLRSKALLATTYFLQNEMEPFHKLEKEILEADKQFGELYYWLGNTLKDLYRFADAVPWLEKALQLDSEFNLARTDLGQAYTHSGAEAKGVEILKQAEQKEAGFVLPWRKNMLKVLEIVHEQYVEVKDPPFQHYFHPSDAAILKVYLLPLYQEAWKVLADKYGFTPKPTILVETFQEAGDFSARTIGYTGFGALGACFGPVITAVSPMALEFRKQHRFNYLGTAWHEFTHVITLGLSNARIPRWLTEGLSTYEEVVRNPSYTRGMDLELLHAYANDQVIPLIELNAAFRSSRIIFGYYQAGLICEFLAHEFSFSRLVKMVRLYGEDKSTEEIFAECFAMTPEVFDRKFLSYIEGRLQDVRIIPAFLPNKMEQFHQRVSKDPQDFQAQQMLAWGYYRMHNLVDAEIQLRKLFELNPDDGLGSLLAGELAFMRGRIDVARERYAKGFAQGVEEFFCRMHYAQILENAGELGEAKQQYQLAKQAFPRAKDPAQSPHLALRRLYEGEGKLQEAMAELQEFVALDAALWQERLELASWYEEKADYAAADRYFYEANGVEPFYRDLHIRWARMLHKAGHFTQAVREWQAARDVEPQMDWSGKLSTDPNVEHKALADLWLEQALTEKQAQQFAQAKQSARAALQLNPALDAAKNLMDQLP